MADQEKEVPDHKRERRLIEAPQDVNPVQVVHAWKPERAGVPLNINIHTHHFVYEQIMDEGHSALPNETGGCLLGYVRFDPTAAIWYVEIDEALPLVPSEADPTHFSFTWKDVDRVRTYREQQGKALIGWYHTHPDMGIFLSSTDIEKTHRRLFNEPFQVALVYDPVCECAGYFYWESPGLIDTEPAAWREFELSKEPATVGSANLPSPPAVSAAPETSGRIEDPAPKVPPSKETEAARQRVRPAGLAGPDIRVRLLAELDSVPAKHRVRITLVCLPDREAFAIDWSTQVKRLRLVRDWGEKIPLSLEPRRVAPGVLEWIDLVPYGQKKSRWVLEVLDPADPLKFSTQRLAVEWTEPVYEIL